MAIQPTDLKIRLSGGAANASAAASLGGARSSTLAPASLFATVQPSESAAGVVKYRCTYVCNDHATLTAQNAVAWLPANTPSTSTLLEIGVGTAAVNGVEQSVADENTAPAGVTFVPAASYAAGVALGSIPPAQGRALWERLTVSAGATARADGATLRVTVDTAA
jgi:hypothetical protein